MLLLKYLTFVIARIILYTNCINYYKIGAVKYIFACCFYKMINKYYSYSLKFRPDPLELRKWINGKIGQKKVPKFREVGLTPPPP